MRGGDFPRAVMLFRRHLQTPQAVWQDERCLSMLCLAGCCRAMRNDDEAERWLLRACAELPHTPHPWEYACLYYRSIGQTDAAAWCASRAERCRA